MKNRDYQLKEGLNVMSVNVRKKMQLLINLFCIGSLSGTINAAEVMRDMTSMEIVHDMKVGWNLGNTLDAWVDGVSGLETETSWGNPKTTKALIDALKEKGFKTVRVPVTWKSHFGAAPSYTIDKEWLDRVEEVINYVLDNGMYAILNSHHDEWVTLTPSSQSEVTDKITKIWAQIADRFKDYSDYLIFETLNEPRLYGTQYEWTGGTAEARNILNAYNLAIVNTIRSSGGNNAKRHIMIPTHAATPMDVAQDALVIPNNDKRIIVSQHTYWPYNFTMNTGDGATTSWGSQKDQDECIEELDRIANKFVKKGIPVIIGEWGSIERSNTDARAFHAEFYAREVRKRGMLPVWWDNGYEKSGGFALISRKNLTWVFPSIADGIIKGVNDGTPVSQKEVSKISFNTLDYSSGKILYSLQKNSFVTLNVYNMMGRSVYGMKSFNQPAGNYSISIPIDKFSSGKYVLQLKTNDNSVSKKITFSK